MSGEIRPWDGITEGRIVHVRPRGVEHCQPAIVVRLWSGSMVNLEVFRDGSNDRGDGYADFPTRWMTSVQHESVSPNPENAWHWPERA